MRTYYHELRSLGVDERITSVDEVARMMACGSDHQEQVDKNGEPYVEHLRRVAARMGTKEERALAWLHDIVEDSHLTISNLREWYGCPGWLLDALDAITHRGNEPRAMYYERVKANPLALAVKLADIADNTDPRRLIRLPADTMFRLMTKYGDALDALAGPLHPEEV